MLYLVRRWDEGCRNGKKLYREIRERGFAAGLKKDLDAVRAGLTEEWSSGPVEGFVHKKLKLLERQGYGRAGFELLSARLLAA